MKKRLQFLFFTFALLALAFSLSLYLKPLPIKLSFKPSKLIEFSGNSPAYLFLSEDDKWRIPVKTENVDEKYIKALIRYEDKRFYKHFGFDPIAILRSAYLNLKNAAVVSGASTITMQLVRVLEPRPRTFYSKFIELFRAIQLEIFYSKEQIFSAYLNFIPFGKNIEGIETACLSYFGHRCKELSEEEVSVLLSVPQKPSSLYPNKQNKNNLQKQSLKIFNKLIAWEIFDLKAKTSFFKVPNALTPFPKLAAHSAHYLIQKYPNQNTIKLHLDQNLQIRLNKVLGSYKKDLEIKGINHVSAIVLENKSGQIKAIKGGFDFWSKDNGNQIPSFAVARSTGSTLKPFIYAKALDMGVALPQQLLFDIPRSYGGYTPKNYDGNYSGLVRMDHSLRRSLNVPFIRLLQEIGLDKFTTLLDQMGVQSLVNKENYYGLSAAIGGIELSPLDMAKIYLTLANKGVLKKVHFIKINEQEKEVSNGFRLFSEESIYLLKEILSQRDRPDFPNKRQINPNLKKIYWKTGTSFGHRDAWSVGFSDEYTVVVWLGNLDNEGSKNLVGADAAGPIFFNIIEELGKKKSLNKDLQLPEKLGEVEVCSYSGHLPSHFCPNTKTVLAKINSLPTVNCPYHLMAQIDKTSGLALKPGCRSGKNTENKLFLNYPSEVKLWLNDQDRSLPLMPEMDPNCKSIHNEENKLEIISPKNGQTYFLIDGIEKQKQEIPFLIHSQFENKISWFLNGKFIGQKQSHQRLWWNPELGKHELIAQLPNGKSTKVVFKVNQLMDN